MCRGLGGGGERERSNIQPSHHYRVKYILKFNNNYQFQAPVASKEELKNNGVESPESRV